MKLHLLDENVLLLKNWNAMKGVQKCLKIFSKVSSKANKNINDLILLEVQVLQFSRFSKVKSLKIQLYIFTDALTCDIFCDIVWVPYGLQ